LIFSSIFEETFLLLLLLKTKETFLLLDIFNYYREKMLGFWNSSNFQRGKTVGWEEDEISVWVSLVCTLPPVRILIFSSDGNDGWPRYMIPRIDDMEGQLIACN
jgi:hypothetical protein